MILVKIFLSVSLLFLLTFTSTVWCEDDTDDENDQEAAMFDEGYGITDDDGEEDCEMPIQKEASGLSISREHAAANYYRAGTTVAEPEQQIKCQDFSGELVPSVELALNEVLSEINLPYQLADFQKIGVIALAAGRSVVIVVGTGEGKMTVPLLTSLVIRKTKNKPLAVTVITQPLTGLMLEQLKNPVCPVAILSMTGELSTADGKLSCDFEDAVGGKYSVVLGHPESFATPLGRRLLTALQRNSNLVLTVIDEFHLNTHWEAFRPEMMRRSMMRRRSA